MQIDAIYPATSVEIECDDYVPLVVRFGGYDGPVFWAPLYWRTGDFKRSLVEVAVDPASGAICTVVLVCLPVLGTTSLLDASTNPSFGLPAAALSQWPDKSQSNGAIVRIDYSQQVTGMLVERELTLVFGDAAAAELERVQCDRVTFLIDSAKNLRGLQIADLSHEECENLRVALA